MSTKFSHLFLVALAGSGAFVGASRFTASGQDIEVVEATRPASSASPVPEASPSSDASLQADPRAAEEMNTLSDTKVAPPSARPPLPVIREKMAIEGTGDAFRSAAWTPPPPPPPPPAPPPPPPPPPSAPPVPFSFVGLLEQKSSKPTAFLAKGESLVIAGVGDVIDGVYRVESLSPAGVVVTYLPLNQRQTVGPTGGTP